MCLNGEKLMKICLAASGGGHLTEIMELLPILKKYQIFFFTFKADHIEKTLREYKGYYVENPVPKIKMLKVIFPSVVCLLKEKPNVIISTGSNITIPIFILGKLLGCKTIYIECSAQVRTPSLSGKICYLFADLFIVQWKYLLNRYGNKAIYGGLLI